jgi:ABC-2 type transport system permease protein
MASNNILQPLTLRASRAGFGNIFRKENRDWWGTKTWLVQAIIWTAILIGIVATVLLTPMEDEPAGGKAVLALTVFFLFAGIALPIGVIIMGQEEVLDEKRSGTVAWILSKPVSRCAFILAKVIADAISILLIMILLEGALAYALIAAVTGQAFPLLPYLGALGVLYLDVMFYFLLSLMFSAASDSRGAAIGIPMAILFGYQVIVGIAPWTLQVTPWSFTNGVSGTGNLPTSLATALAQGQTIPVLPVPGEVFSILPIIVTIMWCLLFVMIAMWRFNRDEF